MSRSIPRLIWLATLGAGVVLGIWPGIAMGQSHYIWFSALLGWYIFPLGLYQFITGQLSSDPVTRFTWLMSFGYPLAMLGYSACAYWTMRHTGVMRKGLLVVVVAACASALATIPVTIITLSIDQGTYTGNLLGYLLGYVPALPPHGFILINLLISAVLGWLIGAGVVLLRRRSSNKHSAATTPTVP